MSEKLEAVMERICTSNSAQKTFGGFKAGWTARDPEVEELKKDKETYIGYWVQDKAEKGHLRAQVAELNTEIARLKAELGIAIEALKDISSRDYPGGADFIFDISKETLEKIEAQRGK